MERGGGQREQRERKKTKKKKVKKNKQKKTYILTNLSPNIIMTLKLNDLNTRIQRQSLT